jgi:hypothetical protein
LTGCGHVFAGPVGEKDFLLSLIHGKHRVKEIRMPADEERRGVGRPVSIGRFYGAPV